MNKKNILIIIIVLVILAGGYWYLSTLENKTLPLADDNRTASSLPSEQGPGGKLKVANFSGKLEKVNTGCFADGECYVVVDQKHITTTIGWSQETVGSVQGVESIGDLESHIGENVEVYAKDKGDGTYTLYGSTGFYVKLIK